jgi:muconolactone D-isomerase
MMMEFLVDMVTTVPDGTTDAEVDAIRIREAARSREMAAQGHLLRLWRPPLDVGAWRKWGLFPGRRHDRIGERAVVDATAPLAA